MNGEILTAGAIAMKLYVSKEQILEIQKNALDTSERSPPLDIRNTKSTRWVSFTVQCFTADCHDLFSEKTRQSTRRGGTEVCVYIYI